MSSRGGPYRRHTTQFKLQLCHGIRSEALGRRGAQKKYALSANLIRTWLTQYDRGELDTEEAEASVLAEYETDRIWTERTVHWTEFADLMQSVGWGRGYDAALFRRPSAADPLVVHARCADRVLFGYVSAFSDCASSTMLGELVVRPTAQGAGIGRALRRAVEAQIPGIRIYVKVMGEAKHFSRLAAIDVPAAEMTVLFKKPAARSG